MSLAQRVAQAAAAGKAPAVDPAADDAQHADGGPTAAGVTAGDAIARGTQAAGTQAPGTQAAGTQAAGTQDAGAKVDGAQDAGAQADGAQADGARGNVAPTVVPAMVPVEGVAIGVAPTAAEAPAVREDLVPGNPGGSRPGGHGGLDAQAVRAVLGEVRSRLAAIAGTSSMTPDELRRTVDDELAVVLASPLGAPVATDPARVRSVVMDEILGFGLLQDLLDDPAISEVMVNGAANVFVESGGRVRRADRQFESDSELVAVINRMVRSTGRRVDQTSPMVDARLPDGSRLNVVLPPLAVDGPAVTIRKFTAGSLTMADLIARGSVSDEAAAFLRAAVEQRANILVTGGTGTGKTTMLNFLSSYIDHRQRVVTVEDAVELSLDLPNLIRLETRPASIEGTGQVTIRDLVRNALRMRPDRIVVGEVRGAEALDMLQAMNTGHEGSLSTLHANSPRDALRRIETMVLFGGIDLPLRAIREQVASAVDLVVQVSRDASGFRHVSSITEVVGMEADVVSTAELYRRSSPDGGTVGPLVSTGIRCSVVEMPVGVEP